jgi:hypothetical protein
MCRTRREPTLVGMILNPYLSQLIADERIARLRRRRKIRREGRRRA